MGARPGIVFIPDGHLAEDCPCKPSCVPSWAPDTGLVLLTGHHPDHAEGTVGETVIRNPKRGKAHRDQSLAEAIAMGTLPGAVTGCSRWARNMTERVPLAQTAREDRCRRRWPAGTDTKEP